MDKNKIEGISLCVQALLYETVALIRMVLILSLLISGNIKLEEYEYMSYEEKGYLWEMILWLAVIVISGILTAKGRLRLLGIAPKTTSEKTTSSSYSYKPNSGNTWTCKCGKVNMFYKEICSCGEHRPN